MLKTMISLKSKSNIIIYGSSGYIGSNFIDSLNSKGFEYTSVSRRKSINSKNHLRINSYSSINLPKKVLKSNKDNILFYLCSETSVSNVNDNVEKNLKDSLDPLIALFRYVVKNNVLLKIVFTSTVTIFGSNLAKIDQLSKPNPETFFDAHKLFVEQYLQIFSQSKFFKYLIIRLPNIYGSGLEAISKKTDRGILNKIILNSINNDKFLYIYGDGNYYRDFIYIEDLSILLTRIIEVNIKENMIANLNSNEKTTLNDFFKILKLVLKNNGIIRKIKHIPWPNYALPINKRSYHIKDQTLFKIYDWKPQVNLKKGIYETIKFFKNKNY